MEKKNYDKLQIENILNLIKYHTEQNALAFRSESEIIAKKFKNNKVIQNKINRYVLEQNANITGKYNLKNKAFTYLTSQSENECFNYTAFPVNLRTQIDTILKLEHTEYNQQKKILLKGVSGTGKTEAIKYIARFLNASIININISDLLTNGDSYKICKNIKKIFKELNCLKEKIKYLIVLDNIDVLNIKTLNLISTTLLNELEKMDTCNKKFIATTTDSKNINQVIINRFDMIINFDTYYNKNLFDIALYYIKFYNYTINEKFLSEILSYSNIKTPAEIVKLLKICIAVSEDDYDLTREIYYNILVLYYDSNDADIVRGILKSKFDDLKWL